MPLLEVHDLRIVFDTEAGTNHAVDGVSFAVEKGRTLGLAGESGCGKSVSAQAVLRLIPSPPGRITGGQVLWKGTDLLELSVRKMTAVRGTEISMIFQDPMTSLNPVFKIGRLFREVMAHRYKLKGPEARSRAIEALGSVGIPDPESRLDAYPHELSGGMKQRVLIALALLAQPDLLIADEPTTALDVTIQKQILYLISDLQRRTNMAVILITHDIGVVAETCDDVAVMYAGRIVETANVLDLFEKPGHPYTRGLLNSIPKKGLTKDQPLPTIEGTVPQLFQVPVGCRFAPRCPFKQAICEVQDPPLVEVAPGHWVACHFPPEMPGMQS